MTEDTKRERRTINDLLNRLEDSGWIVENYNPTVDPYEELRVTVDLRRVAHAPITTSSPEDVQTVLDIVKELEGGYDEGAPIEKVVEEAGEEGMGAKKAIHEIEQLKQKGEVYEPRTDYLRTT